VRHGLLTEQDLGSRAVAKVTRRLIPFLFLSYVVAYLDRVNIGFAAKAMQADLGLSNQVYGVGAGLFFLGYFLFEIPSNLILERVGARRWIARIMIVWGLVSMATMFVVGRQSFYGMRILLGLAEAGFFPGVILYLTYWVPAGERAKNGALFMMAAPVAMIIGAPVSALLLAMDGTLGLEGWQWLFLLEGLPAAVLGVMALWWLTDRPEHAAWLAPAERDWLSTEMAREQATRAAGHKGVLQSLLSSRVWLLNIVYFLNTTVTYGLFLWLPTILADASGYSGLRLSFITMIPFVFALVAMVIVGKHSDRTGERKGHVALCALVAAVGVVLAVRFQGNIPLLVLSFTLCQIGQRSVMPPFWAIPPIFLGGSAAAAGIALINSIGNLGGYAGPTIMGWLREQTGGFSEGLLVLATALLIEAIIVLTIRLPSRDGPVQVANVSPSVVHPSELPGRSK
jgi:MFS transporter, ACS family, tartrate transporter